MAAKNDQVLPTKDAASYKDLVRFYEDKNYKKALKVADSILAKHPTHGETQSMKGLVLYSMDQKEEGMQLAKEGLKNNMKSHVCWHVLGIVHRIANDFQEAKKCFQLALKRDPENMGILRELAGLQIQCRDFAGFAETRRRLTIQYPNKRTSWMMLGFAHHLRKDYKSALEHISTSEKVIPAPEKDAKNLEGQVEYSESLLYKNQVIFDSGDYAGALQHLEQITPDVFDKAYINQQKGRILMKLGRFAEATNIYMSLLTRNPDNYSYHFGLQSSYAEGKETSDGNVSQEAYDKLVEVYANLNQKFPKSETCKLLPLRFYKGEHFETNIRAFVLNSLRKGIPSLFSNLKPIIKNQEKSDLVERLILEFIETLRKTGKLDESGERESPACLLYGLYFAAQFYDKKRDSAKAIAFINEAIEHTPTLPDLYLTKARIYKHSGDLNKAREYVNEARELDLADRNLNTKCVKYTLRNDQPELAESIASLFIKDEDTASNLNEMQCMWYENEVGQSYLRQGVLGKALKFFTEIKKHMEEMVTTQFEFHGYIARKLTLRSYLDSLKFADNIYSHPFYFKGARGLIQSYIALHESLRNPKTEVVEEDVLAGMDEQEKKKHLNKLKREQKQKQKKEETAKLEAQQKKQKAGNTKKKVDNDPDGNELLKIADPLAEAGKIANSLQSFAGHNIETHHLSFEVNIRRAKYLLALRSIVQARAIDQYDHTSIENIARLFKAVNESRSTLPPLTFEILLEELKTLSIDLANPETLVSFTRTYVEQNSSNYTRSVTARKVLLTLVPEEKTLASRLTELTGDEVTWESCKHALPIVKAELGESTHDTFLAALRTRFPLNPVFQAPSSSA